MIIYCKSDGSRDLSVSSRSRNPWVARKDTIRLRRLQLNCPTSLVGEVTSSAESLCRLVSLMLIGVGALSLPLSLFLLPIEAELPVQSAGLVRLKEVKVPYLTSKLRWHGRPQRSANLKGT